MGAGASASAEGLADQDEVIASLEHIRNTIQHLHQAHTAERELTSDLEIDRTTHASSNSNGRLFHHLGTGSGSSSGSGSGSGSGAESKFDPTSAPRIIVRRSNADRPPTMGSSASSPTLHRAMIPEISTGSGGSGVGSSHSDARLGIHHGVTCDGCGINPMRGLRFKCGQCPDYDLCRTCYRHRSDIHSADHSFRWVSHHPGTTRGDSTSTSTNSPTSNSPTSNSATSSSREDYNDYAVAMTTSNNARQLLAMSTAADSSSSPSPSRLQARLQRRTPTSHSGNSSGNHPTAESSATRQFYCHQCNKGFTLPNDNASPQCTECSGSFVESWEGLPNSTTTGRNNQVNFQRNDTTGRLQRRSGRSGGNLLHSSLPSVQEVERVLQELQMLQHALTQRGDLLQNALREQAAAEEKSKPKPARPDAIQNLPTVTMKLSFREKASHCSICLDGWVGSCEGNRLKKSSASHASEHAEHDSKTTDDCKEENRSSTCGTGKSIEEGTAVQLPCSHFFHRDCIADWLQRSGTCPICRTRVKAEGEESEDEDGGESKVDIARIVESNSNMMRYHLPLTAVSLWEREGDGDGGAGGGSESGRSGAGGGIFTVEEARMRAQTMVRSG